MIDHRGPTIDHRSSIIDRGSRVEDRGSRIDGCRSPPQAPPGRASEGGSSIAPRLAGRPRKIEAVGSRSIFMAFWNVTDPSKNNANCLCGCPSDQLAPFSYKRAAASHTNGQIAKSRFWSRHARTAQPRKARGAPVAPRGSQAAHAKNTGFGCNVSAQRSGSRPRQRKAPLFPRVGGPEITWHVSATRGR